MKSVSESGIDYTLQVSARARRMRMAVHFERGLVVTVPQHISIRAVEEFVTKHRAWALKKLSHLKTLNGKTILKSSKKEYTLYKEQARDLVLARLTYFNALYGFSYRAVSVRNQTSRWGSCSRSGALSFNYKIVHLPPHLVDYIVVHELCHLGELNHSKRFWDLVGRTIQNYNSLRKELRVSYVTLK